MSEEKKQLFSALVAAQLAIRAVAKDSQNSFHKYAYASSEDVIAEARHALNNCGLAMFAEGWGTSTLPVEGAVPVMSVHYVLVHNAGESMRIDTTTPVVVERGKPLDKAEAAALTLNLAYTLRALLLIPRGEDDTVNGRDDRSYEPKGPAKARPEPFGESEWLAKISQAPAEELPAIAKELSALVKAGAPIPQSIRDAYAARKAAA